MTKLEAFQYMILNIATIRTIQEERGANTAAACFETALELTENVLNERLAEDSEMVSAAEEFVDWEFGEHRGDWLYRWHDSLDYGNNP
jgi:hypothetical protein